MQVSLLLNQLSVNLTKGERVTLRTFAVNSVGTSDPVSVDVIVPCELWTHMGQYKCGVLHFYDLSVWEAFVSCGMWAIPVIQ